MLRNNATSRRLIASVASGSKQATNTCRSTRAATTRKRFLSVKSTGNSSQNTRKISSSTSSVSKSAQAVPGSFHTAGSTASGRLFTRKGVSCVATNSSATNNKRSILPLDFVLKPSTKAMLPMIGNASYVALASGFLMTDMLELRVLLVSGYTGLVAFHTLHERPLRIPLTWSAIFVAVNAVAAGYLIMDRYGTTSLNSPDHPDGEKLYQDHFAAILTRGQFYQLLSMTRREIIPAGTVLTRENRPCDAMYFIVQGQALVYHGKTAGGVENNVDVDDDDVVQNLHETTATTTSNIATIEQGGFVNDVAFQRGAHVGAYGTVITSKDSDVLVWDTDELRQRMESKPDMERNMKYCLSDHLVKSLLRQREAAHKRQQQSLEQS